MKIKFFLLMLLLIIVRPGQGLAVDGDPVLVPGSIEITTLGTITTGTWEATTIETLFGGTGQITFTDGQLLIGDTGNDTLQKNTIPTTASVIVTNGPGTIQLDVDPSGIDHGGLAGLTDDDHPGYLWGLGRTGDQTLIGSTDSGGSLKLQSTSHGTPGLIEFGAAGNSVYDEANDMFGIGMSSNLLSSLHISNAGNDYIEIERSGKTKFIVRREGTVTGITQLILGSNINKADISQDAVIQIFAGSGDTNRFIIGEGTSTGDTAVQWYYNFNSDTGIMRSINTNVTFKPFRFECSTFKVLTGTGSAIEHFTIDSNGLTGNNQPTPIAQYHVVPNATTTVGQIIQLAPSQTADGWQLQNSALNILASFDKDGGLETAGGRKRNNVRITAADSPYTVLATDHKIFCDSDGGGATMNLPAGVDDTNYIIVNTGSSGNDCIVDPNGTEQLYGNGAGVSSALHDTEKINIDFETTEHWW